MELLDENPDCTETMSMVAEDLLAKFYQVQDGWVVLVGDGKTYRHLMNVKKQYSTMLRKLLIFPGDWHILKNYQPVLMKEYYSAGLREMAKNSGYHGTTLKSLEHCSNFKRTHYFLLQTWEALYREMWHANVLNNESTITEDATCILLTGIQTKNTPKNMMERICELVKDSNSEEDCKRFVKRMSENDKTWKFWAQFVFTDCFCYFGLYLAIRSSNWELRIASLKLMAPMFAAFDREYYARILPHHLAEIQRYPPMILKCFERGAFTVKLTQQHWRAVALNEAHEMCINKDLKTAIARPTKPYLKKITLFLNDRTKIHNSFIQELFPERFEHHSESNNNILDDSPQAYKYEHNIKQLCSVASEYQLFCVQPKNRQLLNVFTGQVATNEQACDMLSFRNIGEQAYQDYVKYHMLQYSTITKTNLRQHKLLTMASKNTVKRKGTAKERDDKHLIMCLRRHLVWSNFHKLGSPSEVQYSEWPRALADEEGNPHKGNKSAWTTKLVSRYQSADAPILVSHLPFVPHTVIVDAMFLLNTRPLRQTKTFSEYAIFLFNQFILQHFKAGTSEVHLIFDKPNMQAFNPKQFEQARRYSNTNTDHQHGSFSSDTQVPNKWQEFLQCTQCKRLIVEAVGLTLLQKGRYLLTTQQRLILAGCFSGLHENTAWLLSPCELVAEQLEEYYSTAQEADNRMWRHAVQSQASSILIYSPDTDVYNIGLSFTKQHPTTTYVVQINVPHSDDNKYININNLQTAMMKDFDLRSTPQNDLGLVLQTLFICSGCDYISYFRSMGKATVLNCFFQYASFICGQNMPGCLHDTSPHNKQQGFLAFTRLVGSLYFKKHCKTFEAAKGYKTPIHLYNSIDASLQAEERHQLWLNQIREVVGTRIIHEEERVPSQTSLWRHWLRSCWISQMWQRSSQRDIYGSLPPPTEYGWKLSDGNYVIEWESPNAQQTIRDNIEFLLKGCTCKSGCNTMKCGCRKKQRKCGPGCLCQSCMNTDECDQDDTENEKSDSEETGCDEAFEQIEEEIITEDDFYNTTYEY